MILVQEDMFLVQEENVLLVQEEELLLAQAKVLSFQEYQRNHLEQISGHWDRFLAQNFNARLDGIVISADEPYFEENNTPGGASNKYKSRHPKYKSRHPKYKSRHPRYKSRHPKYKF